MDSKPEIELHNNAKDVINQLSVVLRTAQIHDANNVAIISALNKLVSMINALVTVEKILILELRGEFFYFNDYRIRYSLEYLLNFDFIIREFKKREIGRITFNSQITMDDLKVFIHAFIAASLAENPFLSVDEAMSGVKGVEVGKLQIVVEDNSVDMRKMVKKSYFRAVSFTQGVINKIKTGEKVNIKKAKRVVESMVDSILEEEQLLIGMTAIKDYDEYTYHHSVNVSILAIALGQRLGLSKRMLTDLGMVSLFHDIGKMNIPHEILNKPANFSDDDWKIVKKHPLWGLRAILRMKLLDEITIKSAIVAFEHHMNFDLSGYPKPRKKIELDLYSRIVSLADQYDAMTSSRVYSRIPLSPDKALSLMMERGGTQLDPLLMKFFTNMLGVYPIGTVVMLDTKELGLVCENNQLLPARPRVMIIVDSSGSRVSAGYIADLTEKNKSDVYIRTIQKTMDPNKYKINLAEYLL